MGCASSTNFDSYPLPTEVKAVKAKEVEPVQATTLLQQRFHAQLATGKFADVPLDVLQLQLQELAEEGLMLETHEVTLPAADTKLGLVIEANMVIGAVTPGRLEAWNNSNPEQEIHAGDRILAVNGVQGERQAMIKELKSPGGIKLLMMRGDVGEPIENERPLVALPAPITLDEECECAVCLLELPAGARATRLQCKHVFCVSCIDDWVRKSPTCPTCRVDLESQEN